MRYWKRVGFAVSEGQALELIDRLADKPHGSVLDDDLEEFDSVGGDQSPLTMAREIEQLFERDYDEKIDLQLDESINWIIVAMEFERNKKQFVKDLKAEGKTLVEAKEMIEDQQKPRDGRGNILTDEEIAQRQAAIEESKETNEEE